MRTVIGLFDSRTEAEAAVRHLQDAGFTSDSIGVAMREPQAAAVAAGTETASVADVAGPVEDQSEEGATVGALSGAGVGVLVGLALVGSTLVLPGIGTFLIGGPLAAALGGASIGAASGGLVGALIGVGIPETDAQHYAADIEQGGVIVSVHSLDNLVESARRILDEEGARRSAIVP